MSFAEKYFSFRSKFTVPAVQLWMKRGSSWCFVMNLWLVNRHGALHIVPRKRRKLHKEQFLPHPFQFIIHQSSYYSTLRSVLVTASSSYLSRPVYAVTWPSDIWTNARRVRYSSNGDAEIPDSVSTGGHSFSLRAAKFLFMLGNYSVENMQNFWVEKSYTDRERGGGGCKCRSETN